MRGKCKLPWDLQRDLAVYVDEGNGRDLEEANIRLGGGTDLLVEGFHIMYLGGEPKLVVPFSLDGSRCYLLAEAITPDASHIGERWTYFFERRAARDPEIRRQAYLEECAEQGKLETLWRRHISPNLTLAVDNTAGQARAIG